ncbi:zf-DHHC-domain-containing protein [Phellopilus nigrolimitatus]|nr:zf-DHHC-domain-containing protein [Phellopilus nigrolimitatus]
MPPLLSLETSSRAPYERLPEPISASEDDDSVLDVDEGGQTKRRKRRKLLTEYNVVVLLVLMLAPQYSVLIILVSYYLQIHFSPLLFSIHLSAICLLLFLACCSLLVCVVRDPGAVRVGEEPNSGGAEGEDDDADADAETDLRDALLMPPISTKTRNADDDFNSLAKWCKKCWAPKPERTHHCSVCQRCVLKMDHHCPWLAQKCVGHWIYTAFLHFLLCITLLAAYVCILSGRIVYVAFVNPFLVSERTALHALFLSVYGAIFSLVVGSFLLWHIYLVSTNQTTIENISPFLLLRYLPSTNSLTPDAPQISSSPTAPETPSHAPESETLQRRARLDQKHIPREHQLSSSQRRHIRYAHGNIRLYDVGWRENWKQVIGSRSTGLAYGDGKSFQRNPQADSLLARLAMELANEDKLD